MPSWVIVSSVPQATVRSETLTSSVPALLLSHRPEIFPEAELRSRWTADVNGDGLGDLVLGVWSEVHGRELAIHLQQHLVVGLSPLLV